MALQSPHPFGNTSNFSHIKSSPPDHQIAINDGISNEQAICRILDANLDRAREGLRTIEEWCRFGLNDEAATAQLKHLRQSIARWHTPHIRLARDTPGDLGTALTHPKEATRGSLAEVLQVNFARSQEALRVLEEYGKLYSLEMAADCKQMRYQLYTLDSQILNPIIGSIAGTTASRASLADVATARHEQLLQARTY